MSFDAVFATFGGEANVWLQNDRWVVLVRPKQVTLGASVLMPKRSVMTIGELEPQELLAFGTICRELERRLRDHFSFDKINYLMLAMKDPLLHFHVIPRYAAEREFGNRRWTDSAWPKAPDMSEFVEDDAAIVALRETLASA